MVELNLNIRKGEKLADQLYGQILQKLVSGELKEGDKLPSENEISRLFSVSRPVIREALTRLQADGLVYSRQGAGTFVKARPPEGLTRFAEASDVAGLLRCFEARMPFEGAAASLAAQRATPEDIEIIGEALRVFEDGLNGEGIPDNADYNFHMAIAKATGNEFYVNILSLLHTSMVSGIRVALKITKGGTQKRMEQVCREHRAIFDAIATGDAEAADLAMRYHIHSARTRVTNHLRDQ
ncbi:FadR family transcriptional regulator [Aestuariirhabdus sp. Z084]|uniref:FadR/GntR family transcriptional regulator n=1 Tax=Aestuariirhabdus haliotis TaxID=2918751 RepID=UPI00201B425A|nr:FadR/GntR family transcriptional regulator [Aestuariirhabdus haliotis]MCL6415107.1 FadR family transcriptional regulator [Aestuariirhabdus haliotis]MCL6419039.1 FadR family transcriptional regulator [Aestuariirhabdus haliotis]